jgi:hypothetical protein
MFSCRFRERVAAAVLAGRSESGMIEVDVKENVAVAAIGKLLHDSTD